MMSRRCCNYLVLFKKVCHLGFQILNEDGGVSFFGEGRGRTCSKILSDQQFDFGTIIVSVDYAKAQVLAIFKKITYV